MSPSSWAHFSSNRGAALLLAVAPHSPLGASSGIGEATAQRLAQAGYKVYGTGRRGAQAHARSFTMLPLDVPRDESVQSAVNEVIPAPG